MNLLYSDGRSKEIAMKRKSGYLIALLLLPLIVTGQTAAIEIDFSNDHSSIRCTDGIVNVGVKYLFQTIGSHVLCRGCKGQYSKCKGEKYFHICNVNLISDL